jgi:hypothetical protein
MFEIATESAGVSTQATLGKRPRNPPTRRRVYTLTEVPMLL